MTIPVRPQVTRLPRPGETPLTPSSLAERSLFFVVPVFGRLELTELCLRQLRWTCDELEDVGIRANAVVIGDDSSLDVAKELRFWVVERENEPVARKFNDGIEAAHIAGAEYVVPCGSDNWVHPRWIATAELPELDEVVCRRQAAIVRADGLELAHIEVSYPGGDGIRIFQTELFAPLGYRPAVDHRNRAIDTSIVERLRRFAGWVPKYRYHESESTAVVGFQSDGIDTQLNTYKALTEQFGKSKTELVWQTLATSYPVDDVERMAAFMTSRKVAA